MKLFSWDTPWGAIKLYYTLLSMVLKLKNLILESGSVGIESEVERQARKDADEQLALAIEDNDGEWFCY